MHISAYHFCTYCKRTVVTKLLLFVSALNSHVKLNNMKDRLQPTLNILLYISLFIEKRKEIYQVVLSEFWLKGLERKQDLSSLVPKMVDRWP